MLVLPRSFARRAFIYLLKREKTKMNKLNRENKQTSLTFDSVLFPSLASLLMILNDPSPFVSPSPSPSPFHHTLLSFSPSPSPPSSRVLPSLS